MDPLAWSGLLFEEEALVPFLIGTVSLGGAAAFLMGRAVAAAWQPRMLLALYTLLIGAAVRFIHFALFGGTLASAYYYAIDTTLIAAAALLGFAITRSRRMARQYAAFARTVR